MHENPSTFERLVTTLDSSERQTLLKQLADTTEARDESISDALPKMPGRDAKLSPLRTNFSGEPLLVRFWFSVVAFFSSMTPERAYAKYLVDELGRRLAHTCADYIDTRKGNYTEKLYDELRKLKSAQDFFSPLLTSWEADKGGFYVVLGSLLMRDSCAAIAAVSDPFAVPYDREPNKDVRATCLREMEAALQAIPEGERTRMYQSARAIEWISRFCAVPVDRMLVRFGIFEGTGKTCLVDLLSEEMKVLVGLFSGIPKIPLLVLEAMFIYARQDDVVSGKFDMERECGQFISTASAYLTAIGAFRGSVPLADFVKFSSRDLDWVPVVNEGGEDWFVSFRASWKQRFDEMWREWNSLHRKAMLERKICSMLGIESLQPLQYHPWEGMWLPLAIRREMTLSFLAAFFNDFYSRKIMKPLKILLIDGDFYRRENLAEYTEAFSTLEHQQHALAAFEDRLSPRGDIGEGFALVLNEKMATIKGKAKLDNLVLTIDSDAEVIIGQVLTAMRSIDLVLGGVLDVVRGGQYETLVNMASIQGKLNEQYRKELTAVKRILRDAVSIINEAEIIEKESF